MMLYKMRKHRLNALLWHQLRRSLTESESVGQAGATTNFAKSNQPPAKVYVLPRPKYGGRHAIALLKGSTLIGKEGVTFITSLIDASGVPVEIDLIDVKNKDEYLMSVQRNRAAVHIDVQQDADEKENALKVANELDLYVFLVKMRSFQGFKSHYPELNIVLIGQNNMGDFSKLEYSPVPGVVETLRVVTDESITRFLCFAFAYAKMADRKRIAIVHKTSETPLSDGRFIEIAKHIKKKKYKDINIEIINIEEVVSRLILQPKSLDVICANDRYSTFLATICSAVCGGANLFSAIEIGDHHAIFKPLQVKLSLTNFSELSPYGVVSTCADLLEYLGAKECADNLWNQMLRTMSEGIKTEDFGGKDSRAYVICNIINQLRCSPFNL